MSRVFPVGNCRRKSHSTARQATDAVKSITRKGGITVVEADHALHTLERADAKLIVPAFKKTLAAVCCGQSRIDPDAETGLTQVKS